LTGTSLLVKVEAFASQPLSLSQQQTMFAATSALRGVTVPGFLGSRVSLPTRRMTLPGASASGRMVAVQEPAVSLYRMEKAAPPPHAACSPRCSFPACACLGAVWGEGLTFGGEGLTHCWPFAGQAFFAGLLLAYVCICCPKRLPGQYGERGSPLGERG
jgi:hypothetical protein